MVQTNYLCVMHYASVENISKSFGIRTLFKNISFYVEEGDKIAFVARNGTGKSTLLKIIAGLDTTDDGTVWVHKDVKVIMLTALEDEAHVADAMEKGSFSYLVKSQLNLDSVLAQVKSTLGIK